MTRNPSHRSRVTAVLGALLIISAGVLVTWKAFFASPQGSSAVGMPVLRDAPTFELKDSRGKAHRLKDLAGDLVLIHFWASWCPPCLEEIGLIVAAMAPYQDKGVKLVVISLDDAWADALKILPEKNLAPNVLSLLDATKKLPEEYGTYQYPETYLLNGKQQILTKWVGAQDWSGELISAMLARAIEMEARMK